MVFSISEPLNNIVPAVTKTLVFGLCFYVLIMIMFFVTSAKFDKLREDLVASQSVKQPISDKFKQLDCLTKNIYWEAASEPFEGKVAVAQVTLNRVASGKFGEDICSTVYQKNVIYEKVICQFSWVCEGIHKFKPVMTSHYKEAEEVAKKVYLENFRLPSLNDALYFHADYVSPNWRREQVAKIGRHVFYK